jgi:hypothetical protein
MWQRSKGLKVFNCRQRQALTPHSSSRKFADQSRRSSSPSSTMILRASVHECKGASVYKNGAKCWVRGCNVQCRSFANSLLAIHYSPLATRHSLPFYHSPFTFATRHSLLAAVSARQNLALPFLPHRLKSVATKRSPLKQAERLEDSSPDAPNFSAVREHCPPDKIIRHSLPFSFC